MKRILPLSLKVVLVMALLTIAPSLFDYSIAFAEEVTLEQIKETLDLTDLDIDDETLEGILSYPVFPEEPEKGSLRDLGEAVVLYSSFIEGVEYGNFAKAHWSLTIAALKTAGYFPNLKDLISRIINLPFVINLTIRFFKESKDFGNLFQKAEDLGEAYWIMKAAREYYSDPETFEKDLLPIYRTNPFFAENEEKILGVVYHYAEAKGHENQIIELKNAVTNCIRERVNNYKAFRNGQYTEGVTPSPTTVIIINKGEYPIFDVVLINERPLWPDEHSEPFSRISAGGKGVLSFLPGVDKIDYLEFEVLGAKVRVPFRIQSVLPLINTKTISPFGDYFPKEVEFDASRSFLSQGAELLSYEWDFGDDSGAKGEKVRHSYQRPGSYTVSLTVSTTLGSSTATKIVEVLNPVSANFTASPEDGTLSTVFQFDASGSFTNVGNITSYEWNFGDGSPQEEGVRASHQYSDEGYKVVTLTVTNNYGISAISRKTVSVGSRGAIYRITDYSLKPTTAKPGDTLIINYTINNLAYYTITVGLACSIQKTGTSKWFHLKGNNTTVEVSPGSGNYSGEFILPSDLSLGKYKVAWELWNSNFTTAYDYKESKDALTVAISPTKDTIPPQVSLGTPTGGENWAVGTQQDIEWSATDNVGVDHVDIQFSADDGVSWSNIITDIADSGKYAWTVPNSVSNVCKVKIIAYDVAGNSGFDVSDGSFTIVTSCPVLSAPTLYNPAVSGNNYTISWSSVSGADSYVLQEDTNSSFSSPTEYSLNRTSKFFGNKASGTYYYRVCAVNECGRGNWSNVKSYTQQLDTEPSKPVAIYPEDDATIDNNSVTLQWESHNGNGQLRYTVYLAHSNLTSYSPIAESITQTSYTVYNLEYNSLYYWRIKVSDEDGDEKLSDLFKFTVAPENNPPTGSVLINDGDATTVSFVVTLTLSATDTQSDVKSMAFSNDGVNWKWFSYQKQCPWNLSDYNYGGNSSNGIKTVYVQFKDSSGNISNTYSDTIEKIDGTPGSIILRGRYYETIRDAIEAAQAGDTVYLTEGIYTIRGKTALPRHPDRYVGIVLKDDVNLIGAGASRTTIIGTDSAWTIIDGNNSTISGLTIINEDDWSPVNLESNSSRLSYCVIKNCTNFNGGVSVWFAQNCQISNNLIINNEVGIYFQGQSNVKIYNNTISNNSVHGITGALREGGHEIRNNIICYNSNKGVYVEKGFVFTNNDVYGNGKNYAEEGWTLGDQTGINGNISSDPRFVNAAARDYRLNAGSPCINRGTNVGIPSSGAPDMGAFEYNGTGTIRVESNYPGVAFTITGAQNFTGSGIDWSVSNVPIGIYSITFAPILNHNTPYYVSKILESNQTLNFDGNYYPDEEPPQVTISINYDEYATADRFVDITLSASDEVAGLDGAEMQFSNNGSNWSLPEPYSSLKQGWDLGVYGGNLTSGTKMVYAKVSDSLGNWTENITDEILYVPNRRILAVPDEFSTIQAAVDAAQEGDMVWVAPGTYQEDIILKEGVILQGSGAEVTTLKYDTNDMITIAAANNSKIDGFAINKGRGAYISISCVNASPIISNNIIYGSRGIDITGDCTPNN